MSQRDSEVRSVKGPLSGGLSVAQILQVVAREYDVPLHDLLSRRRSRRISEPRQMAMYLTTKLLPQHSLSRVARSFHRDPTTVRHARDAVLSRLAIPEVRLALWRVESALMDVSPDRSSVEAHAADFALGIADAYRRAIFALAARDPEGFVRRVCSLVEAELV